MYMGGVKFDFLTVKILDKIRIAMEHLIDDGQIEQKETLRETYNNCLHPRVLNYKSKELWRKASSGEVISLFQFNTLVGGNAIKEVRPKNLKEMATANSLMRLVSDSDVQPLDKFIKYRNNIDLWYEEMYQNGLTEEESELMKKHLSSSYGIAATQEDLMEILMDEDISNFTVVEAHKARKAIAKKKPKLIKQLKKDYFKRSKERAGSSENLINYVWNYCIVPQLGYSFSRNHTLPYSMIALQVLNLVTKYSEIAWNASCLTVESGAIDQDSDKNNSTNYGKIAVAISNMESMGVNISPPDINRSGYVFTPDFDTQEILFGFKGMAYIGDDIVEKIVSKQPYKSYKQVMNELNLSKRKVISLIKSGAFRNIESKNRKELLNDYIQSRISKKTSLSLRNMNFLFNHGFFNDTEVRESALMWKLRKILRDSGETTLDSKKFYELESKMLEFLNNLDKPFNIEQDNNNFYVEVEEFEDKYETYADKLRDFINNNEEEIIKRYNKILFKEDASHYLDGGIGKWEMDSISYYATDNELDYINYENYPFIDKFEDLEIKPVSMMWKDKYPVYHLSTIIGTCLSRNKTKNMVKILTRSGVVTVKFRGGVFAYYDKQVKKNSSIIDSSFFGRGNKVIITGYRSNDDTFRGKTYSRTKMKPVYLVEQVDKNGELVMRSEKHN